VGSLVILLAFYVSVKYIRATVRPRKVPWSVSGGVGFAHRKVSCGSLAFHGLRVRSRAPSTALTERRSVMIGFVYIALMLYLLQLAGVI
jgi:hypothetical protein